jgi:hypothetical protein
VETSTTSSNGTIVGEALEIGLYIFTERHFANMIVIGEGPRQPISDQQTDAERLSAYGRFIADAGSYENDGNHDYSRR